MPAKGTGSGGGLRFPGSRNINLGAGGQKVPLHLRDREPHSLEADQSFANQLQTKQVNFRSFKTQEKNMLHYKINESNTTVLFYEKYLRFYQ